MAEEFQAGICGRNWWDTTTTVFLAAANSSPGSMKLNDIRSNGCPTGLLDMKPNSDSAAGGRTFLIDSTIQTMGFSLSSSSTSGWTNQTLPRGGDGRGDTTLDSITGETSGFGEQGNGSIFKADDLAFLMDQPVPSSINCYDNITTTCQGLSMAVPMATISNGYNSMWLQGIFNSDPQPQQFLVDNLTSSCSAAAGYAANSKELSSSRPRFQPHQHPSSQNQLQPTGLHFSNKGKPKCSNLTTKLISCEVAQDLGIVEKKNSSDVTILKRARSGMLSPLPTFKVRKEKLSDRITALQQLVSPFGKTDTASVLHEATEYIKFLHDQVNILSSPYMGIGEPDQYQREASEELKKDKNEDRRRDLRSRGLCLVPIPSTTYAFGEGNALDFWSPTFGGTFR